jgi:hypothetical protein
MIDNRMNILYVFITESQKRQGTNKRLDGIILKLRESSREPKETTTKGSMDK